MSIISSGEFSVRYTSARECDPSCRISLASTMPSSVRTFTWIPVCFSNAVTMACVSCGCWPLYTVRLFEPPPLLHAASSDDATTAAA